MDDTWICKASFQPELSQALTASRGGRGAPVATGGVWPSNAPRGDAAALSQKTSNFNNFLYKYSWYNWLMDSCARNMNAWGKHNESYMCWNEQKTSTNFIFLNLWQRGPQQPINYQIWLSCSSESTRWRLAMLMNSRSDWWSLHGSGAEHYQRREKASLCPCLNSGPTFRTFLLQAVEKCTIWWSVS